MQAMNLLNPNRVGGRFKFTSGQEVRNLMSDVMTCVGRGRACLVVPKKRTIEEIMQSRNMVSSGYALLGGTALQTRDEVEIII